jgi:5'-3' exonuclease
VRQPQERRPLLVIDGDSFTHRAYHALPKSIRRKDAKPAGAILGFANFLLRLMPARRQRAGSPIHVNADLVPTAEEGIN